MTDLPTRRPPPAPLDEDALIARWTAALAARGLTVAFTRSTERVAPDGSRERLPTAEIRDAAGEEVGCGAGDTPAEALEVAYRNVTGEPPPPPGPA